MSPKNHPLLVSFKRIPGSFPFTNQAAAEDFAVRAQVVVDTFAEARLHDVEALAEDLETDLQNDRPPGLGESPGVDGVS